MSSNDDDMFPPEHYEAIGRLIVACTRLDSRLTELLALFGDTDLFSAIVMVHHQQFASKVHTLKALMRAGESEADPTPPDLLRMIDDANNVYAYRNTLVHATWGVDDEGHPRTARFSARGKFRRSRESHPTQKILGRGREASELADRLSELRDFLQSRHIGPSRLGR